MRVTVSLTLCLPLCLLIGYCQSQAKVVTPDRIKPSSSNIDESKELYSSMLQNKKIAPAHSTAQFADEVEILSLEETKTGNNVIPADELKYVGSWKLVGQSKMNWFKSEEGYSQFFIRQDVNAIFTWLYDGKYNDKNAIKLEIPFLDQDLHLEDGTISSEKAPLTITFINEYEVITKNDACTASYLVKFSFRNESDKNNSHSDQRANASLVLKSDDCHLTIHGLYSDRDQKGTSNALLYTVFVTALCCMHICACLQFMKDLANNPSEASKYSLATIAFFLGWDILLGFYHFYNAVLNPQYLEFFLMPAFWFMTLSTIFEARVLLCIWAIRHHQNSQNVGRRTSFFRFFLGLILPLFMSVSHFEKLRDSVLLVLMMLVHFFLYKNWCLLLSGLFFIPQIIHNAVEDHNFPRDYNYMLGLGLSRMLIPLYARGYSNNVFLLTPDLSFCFWYVVISLTQICVLLLQARLGSRFFIPKIFMPKMFDYYMDGEIDLKTLDTVEDSCSICIQKFSDTPEGDASKGERLMRTPCKHIFHERCLKKWMHIKFECPFCKSSIPPYF